MTPHKGLRLLPWRTPDGNPCYLSTDDTNSHLSRLADHLESEQIVLASDLVDLAAGMLEGGEVDRHELQALARDLVAALRDVLCVAESRGHRLVDLEPSMPEPGGRRLPAAAFG